MAEIILFEHKRRSACVREAGAGGGDAEILFFTGVRYTAYIEPEICPDGRGGAEKARPDPRRKARKRA